MQFYQRQKGVSESFLAFGAGACKFHGYRPVLLTNVNGSVAQFSQRDIGYPMKFSRLLFHRIQSYGISIGYWRVEMCQAIAPAIWMDWSGALD